VPRAVRARIPVYQPALGEAELRNVTRALQQGAISGFFGDYLTQFETSFARFCDSAHGVATSSGTSALHLALAALGIGPGDEVLVSTLTNMATFFAVLYQGATPVPIDIAARGWNLDPDLLAMVGQFVPAVEPWAARLADRLITAPDAIAVAPRVAERLRGDELIVLKASRGVALERILPSLLAKAR